MNAVSAVTRKLSLEAGFATGGFVYQPEYLSLIATFRCNFRCAMCSIWKIKDFSDEMPDAQWMELAPQLSRVFSRSAFVEITGGEPMLRQSLVLGLIPTLKRHFRGVSLNSNGSLLFDPDAIPSLVRAGLDVMKISLYSLNPATHNALRGTPIAFHRARAAIDRVRETPLQLEIGALVTAKNIRELPELIRWVITLKNAVLILQPLDENIESPETHLAGNSLQAELWPETKDVREFFGWVRAHPEGVKNHPAHLDAMERYYLEPSSTLRNRCFVGQRNVVIYPNGSVAFCYKRGSIGNSRTVPLADILKSRAAHDERRSITHCEKYCRIVGCNYSRGIREYVRDRVSAPA